MKGKDISNTNNIDIWRFFSQSNINMRIKLCEQYKTEREEICKKLIDILKLMRSLS